MVVPLGVEGCDFGVGVARLVADTRRRARAHTHTGAHVQLSIAAIEEGWRCKNAPTAAVTASAAAAQAPAAT